MVRYRTGRRVPNTLYAQLGDEPSDDDLFIGSCTVPAAATRLVALANQAIEAEERAEAEPAYRGAPGGTFLYAQQGPEPADDDPMVAITVVGWTGTLLADANRGAAGRPAPEPAAGVVERSDG